MISQRNPKAISRPSKKSLKASWVSNTIIETKDRTRENEKAQTSKIKQRPAEAAPREASQQVAVQAQRYHQSQHHSLKSSKRRSTCIRKNEKIENSLMDFVN